jgi:hypothetical protein
MAMIISPGTIAQIPRATLSTVYYRTAFGERQRAKQLQPFEGCGLKGKAPVMS